jgi:hypothetical protein
MALKLNILEIFSANVTLFYIIQCAIKFSINFVSLLYMYLDFFLLSDHGHKVAIKEIYNFSE